MNPRPSWETLRWEIRMIPMHSTSDDRSIRWHMMEFAPSARQGSYV
jgi:hypothetical protein